MNVAFVIFYLLTFSNNAIGKKNIQKRKVETKLRGEEPFIRQLPCWVYYDSEHPLSYCAIPKNMSTMMKLLFCDMKRISRNETISYDDDRPNRSSGSCSKIPSWQPSFELSVGASWKSRDQTSLNLRQQEKLPKKETNVVIIREPVDRFLSVYGHICLRNNQCGKAGRSVHSMVIALEKMQQTGKYGEQLTPALLDQLVGHFAPQTSFCNLGDEEARKKLKLLRYTQDQKANLRIIDKMFEEIGVNGTLRRKTLTRMRRQRTTHSGNNYTKKKILKEIKSNPFILQAIVHLYYWDYVLLGYPFPKSVKYLE